MTMLMNLMMAASELTMQYSLDLAKEAIEQCRLKGQIVAASVVDADGVPIVALRADGLSKAPSAASRKAATAVAFRSTGVEMEAREKSDPGFATVINANKDIYNPDGGSLPLVRGGKVVGGLAVAYTGHEVADACARAALTRHPLR